jgi:ABC-type branched-subunit amino acid transport system substrate-binding protein
MMKKAGLWLVLSTVIIAMIAGLSLTGCQPEVVEVTVPGETVVVTEVVTETVVVEETTTPIKIGHGTFWTGPFAFVGPPFAAITDFTLGIVNQDPPLGQAVTVLHSDEGTIGEQQWVMRDVDSNKVDILLNVGYEYLTYRDWLLDYVATNNRPLMPSVHGGSISPIYGGTCEEPLFRGSPQDIDQAVVAVVRAMDLGATSCVVMGAEFDSAQQQKEIAAEAAEIAGMDVLDVVDYELEKTYRAEVTAVQALEPDAILLFGSSPDAGLITKTAAELGMSTIIIGPTDIGFPEFVQAATMDAINQHEEVSFVGFTYQDGPAWDYYSEAWESDPQYARYADYADFPFPASNSYAMQYYDLLNVTMLAIRQAGSLDVCDWVEAMHSVANPGGVEVYNYLEGAAAIDAGEDINYVGPTGPFDYTETGVVDGSYSVSQFLDEEGTVERIDVIAGARVIEISSQLSVNQ